MVFDSISSNIDEILSINPSANVFVFGDFNVHHKDWLTYSGGTDRPGELCYSFSISNDLTVNPNVFKKISSSLKLWMYNNSRINWAVKAVAMYLKYWKTPSAAMSWFENYE